MKCKSCKQIIIDGASVCHHCGRAQGKRRFLDFLNFSLVFIISVITLIGLLWPGIEAMWKGKYVDLVVEIVKSDESGMTLILTNDGSVGAGITRVYSIPYFDGKRLPPIYFNTKEWPLLEKKSSKLVVATPVNTQIPIKFDPHHKLDFISIGSCELQIEYVSAAKDIKSVSLKYQCYLATFPSKSSLK